MKSNRADDNIVDVKVKIEIVKINRKLKMNKNEIICNLRIYFETSFFCKSIKCMCEILYVNIFPCIRIHFPVKLVLTKQI